MANGLPTSPGRAVDGARPSWCPLRGNDLLLTSINPPF